MIQHFMDDTHFAKFIDSAGKLRMLSSDTYIRYIHGNPTPSILLEKYFRQFSSKYKHSSNLTIAIESYTQIFQENNRTNIDAAISETGGKLIEEIGIYNQEHHSEPEHSEQSKQIEKLLTERTKATFYQGVKTPYIELQNYAKTLPADARKQLSSIEKFIETVKILDIQSIYAEIETAKSHVVATVNQQTEQAAESQQSRKSLIQTLFISTSIGLILSILNNARNFWKLSITLETIKSKDVILKASLEQNIRNVYKPKYNDSIMRTTQFDNHEIRGLMQYMQAITVLSKTISDDDKVQMQDCIDSVVDVMSNSLMMSAMEVGKYCVNAKPINVRKYFNTMQKRFTVMCKHKEKDIQFVINCENAPTFIAIDAEALMRVTSNFITNGIKFADKLKVTFICTHETLHVTVKDNGKGFNKSEKETIWLPFHQTKIGRTHGKDGTGLGLPLSKGTIEACKGGQIGCSSKIGKESIFWFSIDIESCEEEIESSKEIQPDSTDLPITKTINLLVVDDCAAVRSVVPQQFKSVLYGNLEYSVATCGEEAIQLLKSGKQFDLALVDYHMGQQRLTGPQTIWHLLKINPTMLSFGLSGNGDNENVLREYKDAGAQDIFCKPFQKDSIERVLQHFKSKT